MDKIVPHEFMGFDEPIPDCPKEFKNLSKKKKNKFIKEVIKFQIKQLAKEYKKDLTI